MQQKVNSNQLMNGAFVRGFCKAAMAEGLSQSEAEMLYKCAVAKPEPSKKEGKKEDSAEVENKSKSNIPWKPILSTAGKMGLGGAMVAAAYKMTEPSTNK